jgi:hypothetical protein
MFVHGYESRALCLGVIFVKPDFVSSAYLSFSVWFAYICDIIERLRKLYKDVISFLWVRELSSAMLNDNISYPIFAFARLVDRGATRPRLFRSVP